MNIGVREEETFPLLGLKGEKNITIEYTYTMKLCYSGGGGMF